MLKNRFYLALSLVILFALLLGGCNKMPAQKEASVPQKEAHWYDKYSLESDEVYIWISDDINIKITDKEDIKALVKAVDFPAWEKIINVEDEYAGMEYYYIKFNDQTTIAMYSTVAYGFIGTGLPDDLGNLKPREPGQFNMPEKLLTTVQNLVEKQLKAQAIDFKLPHQN